MTHNEKVVLTIVVVVSTIVVLWGVRGLTSVFSFWPDKG